MSLEKIEEYLASLETEFSSDPTTVSQKNLGADPGIVSDVLSAFDTTVDEGSVDFRRALQVAAPKYFPDEFCKYEYISCGAEDPAMKARLIKLKTRLYYKQWKFNLLREESEGYAKTIAELFSGDKYNDPTRTLARLQKLIGQFNLDPNRVLDILLDCFEANIERASFYTGVLTALKVNRQDLADILKRKFIYQEKLDGSAYSLCNLAAIVCEQDLVDLMPFFGFLEPDQPAVLQAARKHIDIVKLRSKKAEVVVTSTNELKMIETEEETKANSSSLAYHIAFNSQLAEDTKICEDFYDDNINLSKNLKLGLVCAVLERGNWEIASQLMDRFPQYFAVHLSLRIRKALARLIDRLISQLYKSYYPIPISLPNSLPHHHYNRLEHIQPVENFDEFIELVAPLITQIGPYIAVKVNIAFRLLRVVTGYFKALKNGPSLQKHLVPMMDICDICVVPALSFMDGNFAYGDELWDLLSMFTYQQRFRLYSHWKNIHTPKFLDVHRAIVLGRTKYLLKRLSKDTVKLIGRQLGKLCHMHPFAVFDYLLAQVQTFQNLITPVVDSLRFLSSLELDVLTFCVIESLASPDKDQLKTSDGTLSSWIIALATFIGALYKKYPSDLTSMLQFIVNELKIGKSIDLLILREIIANMSGIDVNASLTEIGIDALTGGEVLRQEIFHTAAIRSSKKLSSRLKEALLKDDLLPSLFILMAQQKSCVVYVDSETLPLKLTGQLLDQCRDTFIQFNNFLQFAFKAEELSTVLPPPDVLMKDYYLPIDCAMHFWREIMIGEIRQKWKEGVKRLRGEDEAKLDENQSLSIFSKAFKDKLDHLEQDLMPLKKPSFWLDLTPSVYVTFWLLELGDLQAPTELYEKQIAKAKSERVESHESSKKRQKEDKAQALERKLKDELKSREEHVQQVKGVLKQLSGNFFSASQNRSSQMNRFLQSCLLPRAMFSEVDAAFCAKFIETLHMQKTPNIQTMIFFDKIFCDAAFVLSGLSETESHSIGRFYQMMLTVALRWHDSVSIFNNECVGHPMLLKIRKTEEGEIKDTSVHFEEYRSICFKWHFRLTKTFNHMLNNGSYVSKRNALIVMTKVLPSFPIVKIHFTALHKTAESLRDAEKGVRNDLSLLAASYATKLKKHHAQMVPVEEFYNKEKPDISTNPTISATSSSQTERSSRKRIKMDDEATEATTPKRSTSSRSKR